MAQSAGATLRAKHLLKRCVAFLSDRPSIVYEKSTKYLSTKCEYKQIIVTL